MPPPSQVLPLLIVFGLDYVFWPYYQDSHLAAPFLKNSTGIIDKLGHVVTPYNETPQVLSKVEQLRKDGVKIAVMSFTSEINACLQLLELFGWNKYVDYTELGLGTTHTQLERLHNATSVDYADMLLFDDWNSNLQDAAEIGVLGSTGKAGLTLEKLENGLRLFKEKKLTQTKNS